jgi:hypothetical protein
MAVLARKIRGHLVIINETPTANQKKTVEDVSPAPPKSALASRRISTIITFIRFALPPASPEEP